MRVGNKENSVSATGVEGQTALGTRIHGQAGMVWRHASTRSVRVRLRAISIPAITKTRNY